MYKKGTEPGNGSSCILYNKSKDKILLQLRTADSDIPYPGHYTTFGGHTEPGELPEACALRELKEELRFRPEHILFWKPFIFDESATFQVFVALIDLEKEQLAVREGAGANYFSAEELSSIPIGFKLLPLLQEFFAKKQELLNGLGKKAL